MNLREIVDLSRMVERELKIDPHVCCRCGKAFYICGHGTVIDPSDNPMSSVFTCEDCQDELAGI